MLQYIIYSIVYIPCNIVLEHPGAETIFDLEHPGVPKKENFINDIERPCNQLSKTVAKISISLTVKK